MHRKQGGYKIDDDKDLPDESIAANLKQYGTAFATKLTLVKGNESETSYGS